MSCPWSPCSNLVQKPPVKPATALVREHSAFLLPSSVTLKQRRNARAGRDSIHDMHSQARPERRWLLSLEGVGEEWILDSCPLGKLPRDRSTDDAECLKLLCLVVVRTLSQVICPCLAGFPCDSNGTLSSLLCCPEFRCRMAASKDSITGSAYVA